MTDDKSKRHFRDRDQISGDVDDAVEQFARENGLTSGEVRILIEQYGNERVFLVQAAKDLRERSSDLSGADEVTNEARQQQTAMHLGNTPEDNE